MNAIKVFLPTIAVIGFILLLNACQKDNYSTIGTLKASISGDETLTFDIDSAVYYKNAAEYGTLRQVKGTLSKGGKEYELSVKIQDNGTGKLVYQCRPIFSQGYGNVELIVRNASSGETEDYYIKNTGGEIELSEMDNKTIKGDFYAAVLTDPSTTIASKTITISNGSFDLEEQLVEEDYAF